MKDALAKIPSCREQHGHVVDDVVEVKQKPDGDIDYLVTAGKGKLPGDFYVDCTGFRRMAIGKVLENDFISYEPRILWSSAIPREPAERGT